MRPPPARPRDESRFQAPRADRALVLLGVRVDDVTAEDALARVDRWVAEARAAAARGTALGARQVVTLNPEMLMAAQRDPAFRALINRADLVLPDGMGIVWAAWMRGRREARRVTGVDTMIALAEAAVGRGWRLFLLGAAPGVAEAAAARLCARFPGLLIAGLHAGAPTPDADEQSIGLVRASNADIVFVAYGSPAQERWIARNRMRLGAAVALGVGGGLDFVAGRVPRAPRWMRDSGLEWAYRLAREPWRWRRMLALPRFACVVLVEQARNRAGSERLHEGHAQQGG